MCGIAGIASFPGRPAPEAARLEAMVATLQHRGPDDDGFDIDGPVALGMRRLAVIDVEGGAQPVFNEDRSVRAVFNGEIYNYRTLRDHLTTMGHRFRSASDSEVIVHAYEEYGLDFPKHLNGMFAISLHDSRVGRLLLVRDPVGVKPLYYAVHSDEVVWGSEIKAILACGTVEKRLDVDALADLLAWEYVPGPHTLFASIRKLEPGHLLDIDLARPDCRPARYWDVPEQISTQRTDSDWEDQVADQLRRSTRMQMVSDVPLGAFLSGGVDSSLVVSAMGDAQTFSIGFEDPSYNELEWASRVARHLGVSNVQETINPDAVSLFHDLVHFLDDPIGDFSIFPTYLVSRLARRNVTVALSGDGGDELFGGYESYAAGRIGRWFDAIPDTLRKGLLEPAAAMIRPTAKKKGLVNKLKRFVEGAGHPRDLSHARWRLFASEELLRQLLTPDVTRERTRESGHHIRRLIERTSGRTPVNASLYVDFKSYLCDNILTKVDRMSMAVSLETRVPYLDTDMVELAFQIPDHLKVRNLSTKVLLKRVAARQVPPDTVYRPKEGFSIPIKSWLRSSFRPLMEEYLGDTHLKSQGIFNVETVRRLREEHVTGAANHSHVLWSLIVYQAWQRRWYDGLS
ncbi:MAG: asparagine synthase (glutamine-hydrolyzing) [Rhodothermales bacterium]|nr:asparagine synthase (glutamine-hydrolyzing) [Rhodothermales bacterium]